MADSVVRLLVDSRVSLPALRPLHGVNNGPIAFGGLLDLSERHRELRFPHVRLHDCQWPNPPVVDVPTIFPRFEADVDDPASYTFAKTDDYLASILACGGEIVYRLGVSIEHTARKYHTAPPPDFAKWADICLHIVRHYNEGWANGFRHNIRYWEIWNEADIGDRMWSGTFEEYLDLYAVTARTLKRYDPSLIVGGPAIAHPTGIQLEAFVARCRRDELPLDFCTWHTYTDDPYEIQSRCQYVRALLDRYGFEATESHLNEWNYRFLFRAAPADVHEAFRKFHGPEGASFDAACLMLFQDCPLDAACHYTADTQWLGMFDPYGVPHKSFYAFRAFVELLETPCRVACRIEGEAERILACAAVSTDGARMQALVSNYGDRAVQLQISLPGEPRIRAVDADHNFEDAPCDCAGPDGIRVLRLPPYSVRLIGWGD